MPKEPLKKTTRRGPIVQLSSQVADPLNQFVQRTGLRASEVVRCGLAFTLPRLLNGELVIVNGQIETKAA